MTNTVHRHRPPPQANRPARDNGGQGATVRADAPAGLRGETRFAIGIWAALVTLAMLTVGSAYIPMGAWNAVTNFGIALAKAVLVAGFFMRLWGSSPVLKLVCGIALGIGAILFALGGVDYATRKEPAPQPPPGPDAVWPTGRLAVPPPAPSTRK